MPKPRKHIPLTPALTQSHLSATKKVRNGELELTPRMDLFFEEFLRNGGNATEAAMCVFNCKSRASAASLGSAYLKKAKMLGRVYMEDRGMTYGKILETIAGKALEAKSPDFMDRLLVLLDYHDFVAKKETTPVTITINQKEREILAPYIDGDIAELDPLEVSQDEVAEKKTT